MLLSFLAHPVNSTQDQADLATAGLVGILYPNMWYEIVGFRLILAVLAINFFKMRQEGEPQAASSD